MKNILADKILDCLKEEVINTHNSDFDVEYAVESKAILNKVQKIIESELQYLEELKQKDSLTLTEAIVHAQNQSLNSELWESCRAEYALLAGWLEELREYRRLFKEEVFLPTA